MVTALRPLARSALRPLARSAAFLTAWWSVFLLQGCTINWDLLYENLLKDSFRFKWISIFASITVQNSSRVSFIFQLLFSLQLSFVKFHVAGLISVFLSKDDDLVK